MISLLLALSKLLRTKSVIYELLLFGFGKQVAKKTANNNRHKKKSQFYIPEWQITIRINKQCAFVFVFVFVFRIDNALTK